MNEREIFIAALDKATAQERSDYLSAVCGGNSLLRERVEGLLQMHEQTGDFLQKPVVERLAEGVAVKENAAGKAQDPLVVARGDQGLRFLAPSDQPGSLGRLGHYEVQEVIGSGGMGIVLRAFDEKLHRVVAIKVMAAPLATSAAARKRFLREARAAAAVCHDHIVTIHAVEESGDQPYLVMQCVAGMSLQQRIDRDGPLALHEILRIGMQTAAGLAAAHAQGLIHRDIKPANILLENGVERVKITDFGLARAAADASVSQSGIVAGTPQYMAPEQARGEALDYRTDLFSLGSVLHAMCTGRAPFRAANSMAVLKRVCDDAPGPICEANADVPQWLIAVIDKLQAKNPNDRYQSAAEVAHLLSQRLAQLQHSTPLPPLATSKPPPARPAARRWRAWSVAAAVLLCLAATFGIAEGTGATKIASIVVRLLTPDGTLVVESDDPAVKVTIEGDGGLIITGAGPHEVHLKPGSYKLVADKNGQPVPLERELVSIAKGGREVVRVKLEGTPALAAALSTGQVKNVKTELAPAEVRERQATEVLLQKGASVALMSADASSNADLKKSGQSWPAGTWHVHVVWANRLPALTLADLAALRDFPRLRGLNLTGSPVTTAAVLDQIEGRGMAELRLTEVPTTSKDVARLAQIKTLTTLYLYGTALSDDDIAQLANLPLLSYVNVGGNQITDESMKHLAQLPLKRLYVSRSRVTDVGLARLHSCKSLLVLDVSRTGVTAEGVADLRKALPNCEVEWVKDAETGK